MSAEKKTKPKKDKATTKRSRREDEAVIAAMANGDGEGDEFQPPMPVLPKPEPKDVQETFRCTKAEHRKLMELAASEGFHSMGKFYRARLGLEG